METSYKICVLGKNSDIKEIIVFAGSSTEDQAINPFSENEQVMIETNAIPVRYSAQRIYKDDSISTIKNKLLKDIEFAVSYHELYLFSNISKKYANLSVFFENIAGKSEFVGSQEFQQLLVNMGISDKIKDTFPDSKTKFFLEDFMSLETAIMDPATYYKISIGKRFRQTHNELFSANPYDITEGTRLIQTSTNPLESFENQLLLNNNGGDFVQDMIYVCFASDVFEYIEEIGFDSESASALYFPLLRKKNILDSDSLDKSKAVLIKESKKKASKRLFDTYDAVDIFHDIYHRRLNDLNYATKGVDTVSFTIHPEFKHVLPLDIIFKNVHATKSVPFIKYNPGARRENIYRFYSETITKYGTKIPFLPARTILKLAKETGKNKQISFSVESSKGDFYIDILNNGDIHISGNNFREPMPLDILDSAIQEIVNPVISHMNDFLKKNGYEIKLYTNMREHGIEINYINYVFHMKLTKEIDILKYRNALQPIFEMADNADISSGVNLRYKRVENYSEMNEEDIYIASLFVNKTREEIVGTLAKKYELTVQQSAMRLAQFLRDHEQQQGRFVKNSVKISESPGFDVSMQIKSYDDVFICELVLDNAITDIYIEYIDCFFIYLDGLLRLTQYPKTTIAQAKKIEKLGKKELTDETDKYDNVLTGIVAVDVGLMVSDAYEEDEPIYDMESRTVDTAFGNLDDYENADIEEADLSEMYEDEFESISPVPEEDEFESLSPVPEEGDESGEREENVEEPDEKETEKSKSSSVSSDNMMYVAEEEDEAEDKEKGGGPKDKGPKDKGPKDKGPKDKEKASNSSPDVLEKRLDGMNLKDKNNNIFLSKLKKAEPTIFLSEDDGRYSAYSKLCQASRLRQPIILSPEEKARIDEEDKSNNTTSYSHVLEYGTDESNKNYYICPRYWCLKTNSPISEKDAKEGKKCGNILDKDAKKVKPGHYVVEFNHPLQHGNSDGSYFENTPGFLEGKLHPKGQCMPCCFKKKWDSKYQMERRKQCNKADNADEPEEIEPAAPRRGAKQESYIYEIRRYPIPQKRWGFLPISVQFFLQTDNYASVNPNNNKYLREDKTTNTLLRFGVENSSKKSFIACVADIYAYKAQMENVPTVDNMCEIIANAVSIDLFLKYHNGSLVAIFRPKTYAIEDIDPTKYESSQFMSRLDQGNESHLEFINDTIAAYENFILFLRNRDSYIDHTYLWDIICSPNPSLFSTGLNLAILRIKEVDMTDDIELLCPTSVYSSVLYDIRKETVVLIKHDEYYEPIYLFKNDLKTPQPVIQKTFIEDSVIENVKITLQVIRNSIQTACLPKSSLPANSGMPKTYKFARALPAESLQTVLLEYKFVIKGQVLNYQAKVIGFWLKYKERGIYVPCFPSSQLPDLPVHFMDDDILWLTYIDTVNLLNLVHKKSKGKILSRPVFKVLEDGKIVGVITETNQFIMVSEPAEIVDDDIPVLYDENYLIADKEIAQSKVEDPVRAQTVKMIFLETQFYGAFRTTVRILLNQMKNKAYKKQIIDMIENQRQKFSYKIKYIETLLYKICDKYVSFKDFDPAILDELGEISDCFLNPAEKKFCALKKNGEYELLIPKTHLLSGVDNRKEYFIRMADELLRYKRISLYMMNSKMFLNITNTDYRINSTEMLMLESLLTVDYFKSLEPYEHGDTTITFETANPVLTQKYSNAISQSAQQSMISVDRTKENLEDKLGFECIKLVHPVTGKKTNTDESKINWRLFFSNKSTESDLNNVANCTYYTIIYVYYSTYKIFLTIDQIKGKLRRAYANIGQHLEKILGILQKQGKKKMVDAIYKGKYTLEEAIASEDPPYFLSNLDIWVLASADNLPIILFHQKKLKHLMDSVNWLRLCNNTPTAYHFIRSPTETDNANNYIPTYGIVKPAVKSTAPEVLALFAKGSEKQTMSLEDYFENLRFAPAAKSVKEAVDAAAAASASSDDI